MKHLYRKSFKHAFEAAETAKNFVLMPAIGPVGSLDVSVASNDDGHWVFIAFEGEYDADELFAATGYQRVD